jgi:peptidoglycan/xylan/chitin deacetylase (PgdA/CDA1 family)
VLIISRRRFFTGIGALGLSLGLGVTRAVADQGDNTIYLTFDDGYVGTLEKARALNALGVTGTFFLTGQAIEWHGREVEEAVNLGNRLGNHTYDHPNLTRLTGAQVAREIQRCEDSANRVLGVSTTPLLHAPYFADNAFVRDIAGQMGFSSIHTTWDTNDWAGASASYVANRIRPGVVTMHTQGRFTVAALNLVVPQLVEQGYSFGVLG